MLAFFHIDGNLPNEKDVFKSNANGEDNTWLHSFRIRGDMSSGPGDL